jgi:hypothetical protein
MMSALLVLPLALRHPRHHYTVGARVFALLVVWIATAAVIRFLVFVVDWLRSR